MNWYHKVTTELSNIADAIEYFEGELEEARLEVKLSGNVEKSAAQLPGIVEHRYNQLQEIEAILFYLNIIGRKLRSKHFRIYLESYPRALSSRDVEKYVDGEDEIVDHELLVNEFALLRNKWLGITKAFETKSYSINNIVKLRCAGMEDTGV